MRNSFPILLSLLLTFFSITLLKADTPVCGNISSNTIWSTAGSPYVATCGVTIISGITLTIDPGVTAKFGSAGYLNVHGKLLANGTAGSPITFTSSSASPTAGSWRGVLFQSDALASQLMYATITYAGATDGGGFYYNNSNAITLDHLTVNNSSTAGVRLASNATVALSNSTLSNNTGSGVNITGTGTLNISNSTISSSGSYGVNISAGGGCGLTNTTISNSTNYAIAIPANARLTYSGVTLSGNGGGTKNAISYLGGNITGSDAWHAGVDWIMTSPAWINPGGVLTVDPGVTAKFASAGYLNVHGTLIANGTVGSPITFTSSAASPAPGNWRGVLFQQDASPSQLSYATVSYAGATDGGAIFINSAPGVALDHLTVNNSSNAGVKVAGSSSITATLSNSTLANNTGIGANLTGNGTLNISNTTISNNGSYGVSLTLGGCGLTNSTINNNANYAIGVGADTQFNYSGVTVSGNGSGTKDAISFLGGNIDGNDTWQAGIDWVMTLPPWIAATGTLTINPGVNAKFLSNGYVNVHGRLIANGTAASPIVFTSASASPAPGNWRGILFQSDGQPSQLSYATVSYAGSSDGGGVLITGVSPIVDHVTITNSSTAGIRTEGSASPTITNCSFINNNTGLTNATPSNVITAKLNYWNSTNGPSGSGPGTGQSVSTGVVFEPWLTSNPSNPQFISSASITNRTFNPSIATTAVLDFQSALAGNWTATILNGSGSTIRTFTGSGVIGNVVWDGKDGSGTLQPNGTYNYELRSITGSGEQAAVARGITIIDTTKQPIISNYIVTPAFFSPNGDSVQEFVTISGSFNFDNPTWTLNVVNSSSVTVRSTSGSGSYLVYIWDGKDSSGNVQSDGLYSFQLLVTAGTGSTNASNTSTLDNTIPTGTVTSPTQSQTLSNVYQSGATDVQVRATISDVNLNNWTLERGVGSSPTSWTTLTTGTTPASDSLIYTMPTDSLTNQLYTLRLRVWDKAGNLSDSSKNVTVANFKMSQQSPQQFNPSNSQTFSYTSYVPFTLNEKIDIQDLCGTVVRTIFDGQRVAGTYNDVWNGKDSSASLLRDGPYFYTAQITSTGGNMTWDLRNNFPTTPSVEYNVSLQPFDPFNNQPLIMNYNFSSPGRVLVAFSPTTGTNQGHLTILGGCNTLNANGLYNFCDPNYLYEESGSHSRSWSGTDPNGVFRSDIAGLLLAQAAPSNGATVLFGTKPAITNLSINPALYNPFSGSQNVNFNLTSYQSQPVTVTVELLNQACLPTFTGSYPDACNPDNSPNPCLLRKKVTPNVSPGSVSILLDGKADNAVWLAPGGYTVTVTVTDSMGNKTSSRILTTIQY